MAATKLDPPYCSCMIRNCVHFIAAQTAARVKQPMQKPVYSLAQLTKVKRGKIRSGRKRALQKTEISIDAAPDSLESVTKSRLVSDSSNIEESLSEPESQF